MYDGLSFIEAIDKFLGIDNSYKKKLNSKKNINNNKYNEIDDNKEGYHTKRNYIYFNGVDYIQGYYNIFGKKYKEDNKNNSNYSNNNNYTEINNNNFILTDEEDKKNNIDSEF